MIGAMFCVFPFVVLMMTVIRRVFHSRVMYEVVLQLLRDYLPAGQDFVIRNLNSMVNSRQRVQVVERQLGVGQFLRLHRSGKAIDPGDKLSGNPKLPQIPGSSWITGELPDPGTTQTTGTHGNSEVIY